MEQLKKDIANLRNKLLTSTSVDGPIEKDIVDLYLKVANIYITQMTQRHPVLVLDEISKVCSLVFVDMAEVNKKVTDLVSYL